MISAHRYFPDLARIAVLIYDLDVVEIARNTIQGVRRAGLDRLAAELISAPTPIVGGGKIEVVDRKPGFVDDHKLTALRLCLRTNRQQRKSAENHGKHDGRTDDIARRM